jgi:hypothetical protein
MPSKELRQAELKQQWGEAVTRLLLKNRLLASLANIRLG